MLDKTFVPVKPFSNFKWQWACLTCTEGLNDPVVLLGVLQRMLSLSVRICILVHLNLHTRWTTSLKML